MVMKMSIIGQNKPINEQIKILKQILLQNKKLKLVLELLQNSNLRNYYIGAGAVNQTVFNYYHGFDLEYGIKDFDIVYYDEDTSYEKEDKIIKEIKKLIKDVEVEVDIKNEARVHLWYKEKFGFEIEPYRNTEEAISRWGATITCVGVRLERDELIVFAPYGLNDIFNMIVRPIKEEFKEENYVIRAEKWVEKWPKLKVIDWND
jgi:hypothetical protein